VKTFPCHTDRLKLWFVFLSPDPPSAPRWLEVVNISRNSAELKWAVPERNGGSAITNYIVEKRDVRRKGWQTVDTTVKELKCDVKPLNEGSLYEYIFRVVAENKYGAGPPCVSKPVIAKNPFGMGAFIIILVYAVSYNIPLIFVLLFHLGMSLEPPEAPDKPQVDDITANSMLVTWNEPNDNGSPILGYWVERREINSSHWARVNR
uniref:Fibronectin type-III domain-containing protein n=1 Tax=Astatotilapia calliptera TaxID=8154 RepID=A0AAX7V7U6_ASTCA